MHIATISPPSPDIIDRAWRSRDLIPDFAAAADRIWHTPAGPHLAVSAAVDNALDDWRYDNHAPSVALSAAQRDAIVAELTRRCWDELDGQLAIVPTFPDNAAMRNDYEAALAREARP